MTDEALAQADVLSEAAPAPEVAPDIAIETVESAEEVSAAAEAPATNNTIDVPGMPTGVKNVTVIFRPIWNVEKSYLCGYIIRPVSDDSEKKAQGLSVTAQNEANALNDIGVLYKAAQALSELQQRAEKSIVLVEVNYETLNTFPFRNQYFSMLRRMPETVRNFIVLQIGNIPVQAPKLRLQSIQSDLRGLCRALSFAADIRGGNLDCVSRRNVHACAISLEQMAKEDELTGLMGRFANKATGMNCAPLVDGVETADILSAAVAAGFRYIAGKAVQADQRSLGISRRHFNLEMVQCANAAAT